MPKILFLATEDWFFASHFLPLVKAARDCSLDVVVAARVDRHRQMLEAAGCRVMALPVRRRSLGPASLLREVAAIVRLMRSERPDIVHCIALRMVVLGGIAARITGVKRLVLAVTGLGTLWTKKDASAVAARSFTRWVLRRLAMPGACLVFENHDDPREFGLDPDAPNVAVVPGAGVDPAAFPPAPEPPSPPVRFAVVARMLRTKGIAESVAAARRVRAQGHAIELHLFGTPDPANRDSCTALELKAWAAEPGIYWHGAADDVARVWRDHHVALLLTYREGLPRALVEAAASARPVIATDVPGCREVVRDGLEGVLVPPRHAEAAALAMRRLAIDAPLRQRLGDAAHIRFLQHFTEAHVREKIGGLYRSLAAEIKPSSRL
jgi:glycosyltransferase involved in cell wall biosynthesis